MKVNSVNTSINYVLLVFSFVFPLSVPIGNALMALLILLWVIEGGWREKYVRLRASKAFILYAAFILFLGASLLWSHGTSGGFGGKHASNMVFAYANGYLFDFMLIPIVLTSVKKEYITYMVSAFLAAMFVSEMMSWGIFMGWIHYKHVLPTDPSPFMHHSFYSIFLAVTIFVLVTQLSQAKRLGYKILLSLFILSATVNLFLNGGRLGQLAFFMALFVFIGLKYRITLKSIVLTVGLTAGVFVLAYNMSPIFQKRMDLSVESLSKISEGNYNSSWGIRANILIVAKEIVKENPLLGIGMGNAKVAFLEKAKAFPQTDFFTHLKHLHNGYMQILVESGLLGLGLFLFFIYTLIGSTLQRDQWMLIVTIVTVYLVGFMGEPLLFSRQPYLLFNFFVGLALYLEREREII